MIEYFKSLGEKIVSISGVEDDCWINVVGPSEEELFQISAKTGIGLDFLKASLDEEETSRVDLSPKNTLILIGIPTAKKLGNTVSYTVEPLGIIITEKNIVTVSLRKNSILSDFSDGLIKNVQTTLKTSFVLQILMHMSARFIQYLRQINKISSFIENQLYGTLRNKELVQLYDLDKSLVYFSASLKANQQSLERVLRGRVIKLTNDEHDLLEDVLIEVKQACDMAEIYSNVLSKTTEAFTTVRSNNLNHVLKTLIATIIIVAIPILVAIFAILYRNCDGLLDFLKPASISLILMIVAGLILNRKKML